jgi:hypothetical protein
MEDKKCAINKLFTFGGRVPSDKEAVITAHGI